MNCPFCNEVMKYGEILGDRYRLKWKDCDSGLIMGVFAPPDSIPLGETHLVSRPSVKGYICKKCRKIVIEY